MSMDPNITAATNSTRHPTDAIATEEVVITVETVCIGVVLGVIIFFTLLGNGLVVTAVARFPRLRSVTNMFIVSLAIADITVATLVMPFSIVYVVQVHWSFGWIFCYFWVSCDVMCCTASILHLCVISLDRYLAITQPLQYKSKMSRTRAGVLIAGIWLCGAVVSFIPIYSGWFADKDQFQLYSDDEECGLYVNKIYAVISSCTSFYIPLIVMILAYYKILCIAKKQAKEIQKLEVFVRTSGQENDERIERKSRKIARDRKAVRTLGTLMGLFIISWLPFFLMYVIMPFCTGCHLPRVLEYSITWLGYINSLINPSVYAFLNRDFRMAFKRILCFSCSESHSHNVCTTRLEAPNSAEFGDCVRLNIDPSRATQNVRTTALPRTLTNTQHNSKDSTNTVLMLFRSFKASRLVNRANEL